MSPANKDDHRSALLKRLARLEGQVRGIQAMVQRGDECEAVAQQFSAARKALDRAYQQMLACLIEDALTNPLQSPDEKLAQVRAIFTKYS
jgi:DNA-binding FrmR family transcriptional regulator